MKAYTVTGYKQALQVAQIDEPLVGDEDVLIAVEAVGLNQLDEKIRLGEFKLLLPYKPSFVLGHDVSGTVVAVGVHVSRFAVGDRVFARPRDGRIGTFTERIAADEADVAPAPSSVDLVQAASLPLVALTAWQALVEVGKVQPGQKVLIHAGTGGVGSVAIQLAKHLGAEVATTISGKNAEFVRELGADVVIDYRTQAFETELSGYDLVLDGVSAESVSKSLQVVRPGGKVIGIAGPPTPVFARSRGLNPVVRLVIGLLSRKVRGEAKRRGVDYEFLFMRADGAQLERIAGLVDDGTIRPVVGRIVDFEEIPAALTSLGHGLRGKAVARVGS